MSERVTIKLPNKHTKLEARNRIDAGLEKVAAQFKGKATIDHAWNGDTLVCKTRTLGQTVTGEATVFDDHVVINIDLPWLLARMAGPITEKVQQRAQLLLK